MTASKLRSDLFVNGVYKLRWVLSLVVVLGALGAFASGMGRIDGFTSQVDELADHPPEKSEPRMFDPRMDIWFDSADPALDSYFRIEELFVGEDPVIIAFTESSDPHGVFSTKSLVAIHRLTEKIKKVPYVRTVSSLVANPWIRWGGVGEEEGLIVSDLFEKDPALYTEHERLERMISVLGAENSASLIGETKVREIIGQNANFEDFIGEPRLLGNVLSKDGRSTALVAQVIRPRLAEERLDQVFGPDTTARTAGPAIHTSAMQTQALNAIKDIVAEDKAYEFHLAGVPVMQEHFQDVSKHDMSFFLLMFVAIAFLLLIVYRRVAGALLPSLTVLLAILGMLGVIFAKGDLVNGITAMTPHMIVAIGVANAVHLVTAYYRIRPDYTDKHELVRATIRFNALPVFLASATTAIGFLSIMTSSILPVRYLGYTAAIGTGFVFAISMTLVPSILSLLPLRPVKNDAKKKTSTTELSTQRHWGEPLSQFIMQRRTRIVVTGMALAVGATLGLTRITLTSDLRLMFGSNDPVVEDLQWIDKHIGGTGDVEMLFSGAPNSDTQDVASERSVRIDKLAASHEFPEELMRLRREEAEYQRGRIAYSPKFLNLLNQFRNRLLQEAADPKSPLHILTKAETALSVLRKMHQVQNQNRGAFYRVPTEADVPADARKPTVMYDEVLEEETVIPGQDASTMIAQYYLQFENGAKPEENLSTLISPDRRSFRFMMWTKAVSTKATLAAYERMREIARTEFPALVGSRQDVASGKALSSMEMTGSYYMQMNMLTGLAMTLIVSLSTALIVITILISIVYRSLLIGLVSMIPNVLPIVIPLSVLAIAGIPIDGPAIVVAAIGLGICVDDTIHFLTKYTHAIADGLDPREAIARTFREIGGALTYTSIVLACGFTMMMLATFRPNVMIGLLGAVMVGLAWLADFVLTPAVLSFVPIKSSKSGQRTATHSPSSKEEKSSNE